MKALTNPRVTTGEKTVTICFDLSDKTVIGMPGQQQTIVHLAKDNPAHHRHLQLTPAALFIKSPGKNCGVIIERDVLVSMATAIEPKLSFPALLRVDPNQPLKVDICSELEPKLQWQVSDDGKEWKDIEGQTTNILDQSTVKKGQQVRLKATSNAGEMTTNGFSINA